MAIPTAMTDPLLLLLLLRRQQHLPTPRSYRGIDLPRRHQQLLARVCAAEGNERRLGPFQDRGEEGLVGQLLEERRRPALQAVAVGLPVEWKTRY